MLNSFTVLKVAAAARFGSPDPMTFLQGQATCDLEQCTPELATRGAFCDQKGRVIADSLFVPPAQMQAGATWHLVLRAELVAELLELLTPYARLARVKVSGAAEGCAAFVGSLPDSAGAELGGAAFDGSLPFVCSRFAGSGGEICVISASADRPSWHLAVGAANTSGDTNGDPNGLDQSIRGSAMQQKAPFLQQSLIGKYTPHELGYAQAGLVSFTKGCYLGQEVVARMHHLGNLKKHFRLLRIDDCDLPLRAGQKVKTEAGSFELLEVVPEADKYLACACIKDKLVTGEPLRCTDEVSGASFRAEVLD